MLDKASFMKFSGIKNFIQGLVFWGVILAVAATFLFSMLLVLSPGAAGGFLEHLSMEEGYAYGRWGTMIASILIFSYFIVGFSLPMERKEWRSLGMYEAFLVALFTEMYGFPLTIYILTSVFGVSLSFGHMQGHLLAVFLSRTGLIGLNTAWALVMALSSLLILLGLSLVRAGWKRIYHSSGGLVKDGIYARIRHPQYLGLMIIIIAFLIQWPTILTVLMWPLLFLMYYRLAKREEAELLRKFENEFLEYKRRVPMLLPRFTFQGLSSLGI
jgi:protein-S-isoprenylcysteine O-methyltransferase Ste14